MSFLGAFEDDVFISYASIDDEPLTEGQKGWVTQFHRDLEFRVAQYLGVGVSTARDPAGLKIWRDERELRGNDRLKERIQEQLTKTGIMLSVVSPLFLQSDWCMSEFKEFWTQAEEARQLYVQKNKSRLFKVMKTHVEREVQPPEMQEILSYEFYEFDDAGRPFEYNRELGEAAKVKYALKLSDVAYDIARFLPLLGGKLRPDAPAVYLAETTSDLKEARAAVRRDLLQRGFVVLPDLALSVEAGALQEQVRGFLRRSSLSVHLVGQKYGAIPEGETRSQPVIEAALAEERCSDPGFLRVVWMPPGLAVEDPRQREFVEMLRGDPGAQQRTELLETKLEDLKSLLEEAAGRKPPPPETPPRPAASPLRIYVIADPQDLAAGAVAPLERFLFDQGYEVIFSQVGDDETQTREHHVENLLLCDAALIYHGKAGELWLRAKLNDFRKVLDARADPVRARAVYIGGPDTESKRRFQSHEVLVLRDSAGDPATSFKPLLEAMRRARA
jgi:TIR domain